MFLRKKYHFQVDRNVDSLTQSLKDSGKKDLIYERTFGNDSHYSVTFNWDEFVITRKAEFSRQWIFEPDAHIRLTSLSENLTQVNVTIKLSEISWIILIFIQLGIVACSLFGPSEEWNWLSRIALMVGISALFNFIVWLTFIPDSNHFKKVIEQLFEEII